MSRIWTLALVLVLALPGSAQGADYRIRVDLNPESRVLSGSQTLTWINSTSFVVPDLRFHLYYNAWKEPGTSFLNSNRMETDDFSDWESDDWAYMEVRKISAAVEGGESRDLSSSLEFIQPDDGNPVDQTVARVELPQPLGPGETVVVEIEFEARVPRTFARTGYRDSYFFVAHWFPKLGVFEKSGEWNCRQFIQTEFYSEFGDYEVEITVPEGWVVGATGRNTESVSDAPGLVRHRYRQERVHDFTWTTSPWFRVFEDRFTHPMLAEVDLRLLLMPDHAGQEGRYFAATKAALRYYGEWFGEYPYGHLTIIDPAYRSRSGGMEYPTLFTGGTRWWNTPRSGDPEGVTVHEYGHQIWYGIVANNEFEDAWLDEGINSYSTRRVMLEAFGRSAYVKRFLDGFVPLEFPDILEAPRTASGLGMERSTLKLEVMSMDSWRQGPASVRYGARSGGGGRIYGSGAYGVNSYTKPALMLLTLENHLGWTVLQNVLSTYFERWKFRHPRPEDFFAVAEEVSGEDLSWFWEQTYYSSNVFDYSADGVRERASDQQVLVRRWGEGIFPVEIEVVFESGNKLIEHWDGRARWKGFVYPKEDPVVAVRVDPQRKLALDVDVVNNTWIKKAPDRFAGWKWGLKWMTWLQNMLQQFAFFS